MIKILVTNDDGIDAKGIQCLAEELGKMADVYVVAPKEQQSGKAHSITFMRDVKAEAHDLKGAIEAYAIDGTPADCVKWGLCKLSEEDITPDYVISGINMGHNAGLAAHYSGTIAAAREGSLNGIRSIAISIRHHKASHFDYVLGLLPRLIEMSSKIKPSTFLNVNAPDIPSWDVKGVKVVPAAPFGYAELFTFVHNEEGGYQMMPIMTGLDGAMRYDFDCMESGYVAVSPIPAETGDPVALMKLRGLTEQNEYLAIAVDAQLKTAARLNKPEKFAENITTFTRVMRRMDVPVLFTETFGRGDILAGPAKYADHAERVTHIFPDAWTAPDMEKFAELSGANKILIAGAATNVELLQTALSAVDRGYDVTVVSDCCAAAKKSGHKLALETLAGAGCNISTLETEAMQLASKRPRQVMMAVTQILDTTRGLM